MAKMCSFSEVKFCAPEGLGSLFLPLVLGEVLSISVAPVGSFPEGRKAAVPHVVLGTGFVQAGFLGRLEGLGILESTELDTSPRPGTG